jgi:hypothetical protein
MLKLIPIVNPNRLVFLDEFFVRPQSQKMTKSMVTMATVTMVT